jgi:integrase
VGAVRVWLDAAALDAGPLFRSIDRAGRLGANRLTAQIVAARLKKAVARVGLDPDKYGAHSLRSGFATTAARERKTEHVIMRHGRWKSIVVARRYIRDGARWQEHAAEGIGL